MKHLIQTAGYLTAGVASLALSMSLQAQDGSGKRWNVGLGVRGFYDDNIFTRPDIVIGGVDQRVDSFGFDVTPSVGLNIPLDQGHIDLGYTYGLRWFEDRPGDDIDQYHNFSGNLSHRFSPRYHIGLSENFAMAQEPEQLAAVGGAQLPIRSEGDNIRNSAGVEFTAQLTNPLSVVFSYNNNYFDYDNPSFSQALDRLEHLIGLNLRYQFREPTVGVLGYRYGIYDYTSKVVGAGGFDPQLKDQNSHFIFTGVDHNFTPKLLGSVRVGVQIADWDNRDQSETTPYADASLGYAYAQGSSLRVGVKHQRNATDLFDDASSPILDTETTAGYVSITHAITSKLNISGVALIQSSSYNAPGATLGGSAVDGESEQYWNFGVTLSYRFTQYVAGELSYYYDNLDPDAVFSFREYDRNRVFLGVRLTY